MEILMNFDPPILLSDKDAANLLGISRATFWRRVADKTLPQPVRLGGVTRWRREDLERAILAATQRPDRHVRAI